VRQIHAILAQVAGVAPPPALCPKEKLDPHLLIKSSLEPVVESATKPA